MRYTLIILSTLISLNLFAQKYTGQVIDKSNSVPIPYVNIGVLNKNIGTVSNSDGHFELELNDKLNNETIRISSIGYKSLDIKISDFKNNRTNQVSDIIKLSPVIYNLSEVVVHPTLTFTLGNYVDSNSCYGSGYFSSLGAENGVVMRFPKRMKIARLKSLRFCVYRFSYNKLPLRLNVYNLKKGLPAENILREPISFEITADGEYIIDLTPYNITINNDFFIALEYYRIPDKEKGGMTFLAVQKGQTSLVRDASQGNWHRFKKGNSELGFSVIVDCEK